MMTFLLNLPRRRTIRPALLVTCAWLLPAVSVTAQDFNGDKVRDIVVGVPYEGYYEVGQGRGIPDAGAVDVVYGTSVGRSQLRPQHWTLASTGVPGSPAEGDRFGYALAWGRFDNDQCDDLAIGIPGKDVDGVEAAGAVVVIYGSAQGLVATGPSMTLAPLFLRQGANAVPGVPFHGDNFGFSLAVGRWDTNLAGYLAIGAPGVDAGDADGQGRGEVVVLYFSAASDDGEIKEEYSQLWHQIVGVAEPGDWFGFSLATGDFGGRLWDNYALAIGIPGEDVDGQMNAGAVEDLYPEKIDGHYPMRLGAASAQLLKQSTFVETTQSHSFFGFSLAAGQLFGLDEPVDGWFAETWDELVIGEPFRTVGAAEGAGVVHVIKGATAHGLDPNVTMTLTPGQSMLGGTLIGQSEAGDFFGFAVAVGDHVIAVGAPGKNNLAGSVHVIRSVLFGPTAVGAQVLTGAAGDSHFGWSVEAEWEPEQGPDRILAGAPGSLDHGGVVKVFGRNAAGTFVLKGTLSQDTLFGPGERTEPGDGFGYSLGAAGLPRITFTF